MILPYKGTPRRKEQKQRANNSERATIQEFLEGIFRRSAILFLLVKTFSFCVTNKQYKDVEKRLNRP